jgi:predicted site-specific integrase-resolvase
MHIPNPSATMAPPKAWNTVQDLADRYGVTTRSVCRWAADGVIPPGRRIGGRRRWSAIEIEDYEGRLMANGACDE